MTLGSGKKTLTPHGASVQETKCSNFTIIYASAAD